MFQTSLKSEDVNFFFKVLFHYEKEGANNHNGYSIRDVPCEMRNSISLIHDTKKKKEELKIPKTPNALCFRGTCVCAPLLRHLRNSFAHACIERGGDYYVINSHENPKGQICGKVKRKDLMNLVNGILATKNKRTK